MEYKFSPELKKVELKDANESFLDNLIKFYLNCGDKKDYKNINCFDKQGNYISLNKINKNNIKEYIFQQKNKLSHFYKFKL